MLWLNIKATVLIAYDSLSEPIQRRLQYVFVWLLPLIGALVVFAIHRRTESPSKKYLERMGPDDELTGTDVVGEAGSGGSE